MQTGRRNENLRRSVFAFQPVSYLPAEEVLADAEHARFNCLLLDIRCRGMSGIELSERLKASGSTTPVIMLDRQLRRFCALEDPFDVCRGVTEQLVNIRPIAHEAV